MKWVLAVFLFHYSSTVLAAANQRSYALTLYYNNYSDISSGSSGTATGKEELAPSYSLEAEVKLHSIFGLIATLEQWGRIKDSQGQDTPSRFGYGLGLKIGLPGIFFFGASSSDMRRNLKRVYFNSFVTAGMEVVDSIDDTQSPSVKTRSNLSRFATGLDIFLYNPYVYLTLYGGVITFSSDSFLQGSAGLGFTY